jgi:hypothetical protein
VRLIQVNRATLPYPNNPSLIYPGDVILLPDTEEGDQPGR